MGPLDVAIVTVVGLFAVMGLRRGFVRGALDVILLAAAFVIAATMYPRLAAVLVSDSAGPWVDVLAFAVLLGAVLLAGSIVTSLLLAPLAALPKPPPLRWLNSLLGVLPGIVKGVVAAAAVVVPLAILAPQVGMGVDIRDSRLGMPLYQLGLDALDVAIERLGLDLGDFNPIAPSSPAGFLLPYPVTDGLAVDPDAERALFDLVNAERARAGLRSVAVDDELTSVARAHSEEMFRLGYFDHRSPISGDPADRLTAAGISYFISGENLALAPSAAKAHDGLMASPGHRANILNPSYTRLGIGIVRSDRLGLMISQEFAA
ncbi:MAG: CvpA family protein [Thermomicrobiales bacterium]|nr:CvpA family protein [Thermomicrobiales bacterium]